MEKVYEEYDYCDLLIGMVKAAGQELINRAENLVGHDKLITDFEIRLRFPQGGELPVIEVRREHVNVLSEDFYADWHGRGRG